MSGFVQEAMVSDGSKEQIVLLAQFETGGNEWADNALLQNFLEFPNPSRPGEFIGATCNTWYTHSSGPTEKFRVESMAGESLTNAAGDRRGWLNYGMVGPVPFFRKVEKDFYETLSIGLGGL